MLVIAIGTNVLLLPNEAFAGMRAVFEDLCSSGTKLKGICDVPAGKSFFDGACYNMTAADIAPFPNFVLNVPGIGIKMTPANYLLQGYGTKAPLSEYCLGVEKTGPGGLQILGDTTLENYYVAFNRTAKSIGWAPVNLDNCGSV